MQRYNPFSLVHKALRNMLYDAALTLQQTDFTEPEEANLAIEKIEHVIYTFEKHAMHEDRFVLPAVEKYEAALVQSFESEHGEDMKLGNMLKNLVNIYRNVNFEEEKINAGSALCKAFNDFMVFNLQHMSKEEMLINPVLWKYFTDEQVGGINAQIASNIAPEEMMQMAAWMIKSISLKETITWLTGVKANAPVFVFESLLQLAEKHVPAGKFETIKKLLNTSAIAA
ncbi:hemerythrin domain-containing protein [Panacibacter sp. DH6]|uniref:Hemerythrin domain-containing protein n=1 Tax=Panacibacter microcysteis TaxID=2793269 RepID=A0A931E2J6_9BACT|nr:hemerythrin domain-containing protein [Panacibacter microcysteis]MBG9374957.1 hemerythrin domain-containing protein [Panacibacter microcysteis]